MADTPTIDAVYLRDTLKKMVGIDSTLPHEEGLATYFADKLRAMGVEPEWHEVSPGRPNVCATAHLDPSGRFLVFSGHSDTVASGWETDPFELTEQNGRLYALGTVNMKGGLACSLAAFKALVNAKTLHGNLGRLGFAVTVKHLGLNNITVSEINTG